MGYVQGMSDLASPMLVVMNGDEVDAFWAFALYMERMVCKLSIIISYFLTLIKLYFHSLNRKRTLDMTALECVFISRLLKSSFISLTLASTSTCKWQMHSIYFFVLDVC